MIQKEVICFGEKIIIACDGKCEKAWGSNGRPKIQLSEEDEDDWVWLADDELGLAPNDTGNYESDYEKPLNNLDKLNKWCYRECERCSSSKIGQDIVLQDFSKRRYNIINKNNQ